MTKLAFLRIALVMLALAGLTAGVRLLVQADAPVAFAREPHASAETPAPPSRAHLDSVAELAISAAPFRARRTLPVPYDPERVAEAAAPPPPGPPKPALTLAGIVRGERATAVLDGVPGIEGSRVVARGDTAGGLTIRRIGRDEVVVTGYDTTWTLRLKELQ